MLEAEAEVRVVIQIGAGAGDPVDEAVLDQRNDGRDPQPRRRQRARQAHADGDVGVEHTAHEQLTGFTQPGGVVGEKRTVDQLGDRHACRRSAADRCEDAYRAEF